MPRVSVIIPTFNSESVIKRAIESVFAQRYRDFEILIVDDGSSDLTISKVEPFLSDKTVRLLRQDRKGPSSARNSGIAKSRGELIAFLDSDDIYLNGRIEEGVKALGRDRKAGIVYSDEVFFFEDNPEKTVRSPHPKFSGDIFFYLKRSNFIHTSTVMARRSVFDRWRFDEGLRNHEDWDLFLKISKDGRLFRYIARPMVGVSLRREGLTHTSPEWAVSRRTVGERARAHWKDLKKEDFARYLRLKARAALIGFPDSARFNKKMPHDLLKKA